MKFSTPQLSPEDLVLLKGSLAEVRRLLQDAALTDDFSELLVEAFGTLFTAEAGEALQQALAEGSYDWPEVELLSAVELQGALGAYAAASRTIYLSESWLAAERSGALVAVLLEELGHDLDAQLNIGQDAAGDEGAIFSALIRGESLDERVLAALRSEHDQGSLVLDGQQVAVEFATFIVNSTADVVNATDGVTTLREAVNSANATPGADQITFAPSLNTQTITLSSQLALTDSATTTINGANAITISGGNRTRVFQIESGASAAFDGLAIVDGLVSSSSETVGGGISNNGSLTVSNSSFSRNRALSSLISDGGAINNNGNLTVINSSFSNNVAYTLGGGINNSGSLTITNSRFSGNTSLIGGGINNFNGSLTVSNSSFVGNTARNSGGGLNNLLDGARFTVTDSSFIGNMASSGGGISNAGFSGGTISNSTISNSTISGNIASNEGGGIDNFSAALTISNSTITGNQVTNGASAIGGGGILNNGSSSNARFILVNSIVSGNSVANGLLGDEISNVNGGIITSQGNNLLGDSDKTSAEAFNAFTPAASDINATSDGTNPTAITAIIAPLANNGGPTQTHALPSGSPAINAGNNANIPADATDQDGDGNTNEASPFDQRGTGFDRVNDGAVDAGAIESQIGAPVITSAPAATVDESQISAIDVDATDDTPGVSFSLSGGADAALFNIDSTTGVVTFIDAPDFEAPANAGSNNVYDIQVTATDAAGLTDVQDIAITIGNINETPTITSTNAVTVPENQTAVLDIQSSDIDGETENGGGLTYSLTDGADQAQFTINTDTGTLSFVSALDFEAPTDTGANNIYDVQVTVTDAGGLTDVQDIAVTVSDVSENGAPVIISAPAATVDENQVSVIDVDATDDTPGVSFSLSGGADAALFNIDATTGIVTFIDAPDFEAPADAGNNNVYDIQVTAIDAGGLTDVQDIAVTVNDLDEIDPGENPSITLEKFTNGQTTSTAAQAAKISAGETITWSYKLTNTGDTGINSFLLIDDNGTVDDSSDDLSLELIPSGILAANGIQFTGGDSNNNGRFDAAEVWTFEATDIAQDLGVSVNFDESLINGAGDIITNQYNRVDFGFLEVSTPINPFDAIIFDSANPTGGDFDLGTPTQPTGPGIGSDSGAGIGNTTAQHNVLIISEDGDQLDPDDNADGGTLRFSFGEEHGVALDAVGLLDVDITERLVTAESFLDGQLITSNEALALGDNSFQYLQLQGDIANRLEVNFVHSGAVTELEYRRIFGNTATVTATIGDETLTSSDSSFYTNPNPGV